MKSVIKAVAAIIRILAETVARGFSLVWRVLESYSGASRGCIRFLWRLADIVMVLVGLLVLMAALMIPFPISVARHYRYLSPVEKYYLPIYLRTEFSPWEGGIYRVLVIDDAKHNQELVTSDDVIPGQTTTDDGEILPFSIAPKEQEAGKRIVLLAATVQDNGALWSDLHERVYHRQSVAEMGQSGFIVGVLLNALALATLGLTFVLGLVFQVSKWIFAICIGGLRAAKSVVRFIGNRCEDIRDFVARERASRQHFRELEKRIHEGRNIND